MLLMTEPVPGDLCKLWNDSNDEPMFGKLSEIDYTRPDSHPYRSADSWFRNAKRIGVEEIVDVIIKEKRSKF